MNRSRRNLSTAIIVLLLVMVAVAETEPLQMLKCSRRSHSFKGPCIIRRSCSDACEKEDNDMIWGECRSFPPRCYCVFYCPSAQATRPKRDQSEVLSHN
ncbi:hypothetical protein QOZ80_2AG0115230 [Eleusine coracana subsp. coracana]|nr:hypothetical protein QOZ80_2AG0115230 [Eleusine coracana subsp. coracana]